VKEEGHNGETTIKCVACGKDEQISKMFACLSCSSTSNSFLPLENTQDVYKTTEAKEFCARCLISEHWSHEVKPMAEVASGQMVSAYMRTYYSEKQALEQKIATFSAGVPPPIDATFKKVG